MPELDMGALGALKAEAKGAVRYRVLLVAEGSGVTPAALKANPAWAGNGLLVAQERAAGADGGCEIDLAPLKSDLEPKVAKLGKGAHIESFALGFSNGGQAEAVAGPTFTVKAKEQQDDDELPPPIQYHGGPPLIGITDISGTVKFVKADVPAEPNAWENAECTVHDHFSQAYCADVNSKSTGYPGVAGCRVFGPAFAFHVADRFIWNQTGGAVYCRIADGTTFGYGHMTEISHEVYKAAKSGALLPAGTYLGACKFKIGVSKGAHIHIEAWSGGPHQGTRLKRKDWFPRMRRNGWLAPNDSK